MTGRVGEFVSDRRGVPYFGRPQTSDRKFLAFDTEFRATLDTEPVPRLACLQIYEPDRGAQIYLRGAASEQFRRIALRALTEGYTIVGHNVAIDLAQMCANDADMFPVVWALLDRGLVEDTLLGEKLFAIARGEMYEKSSFTRVVRGVKWGFSLADSVKLRFGHSLAKGEDTWRLRYDELRDTPVDEWPGDARRYAEDDVIWAHALRCEQERAEREQPTRQPAYVYADLPAQTRASWALFLAAWAGIRTDPEHVARVREGYLEKTAARLDGLIAAGLIREGKWMPRKQIRKPPTKDQAAIRAAVVAAYAALGEGEPPLTETGQVSIASETLEEAALANPLLDDLVEYNESSKIASMMTVLAGRSGAVHTEPNALVATGRTSWGSTRADGEKGKVRLNLQNLPRAKGFRESFVPPPGYLICTVDYGQLELCTLAYATSVLVAGPHKMKKAINEEKDLHCLLASNFARIPYDEMFRAAKIDEEPEAVLLRDINKKCNFGFGGGMGEDKFIFTVRKDDKEGKFEKFLDKATVRKLKNLWLDTFPETRLYLRGLISEQSKHKNILQLTSGRIRGGLTYCSCANTYFQGLAADGAKEALYLVQRECFGDSRSVLYGSHAIAFVHDEIVLCVPEATGHECAVRVRDIMIEAMSRRVPGVLVKGEMALSTRWSKKAKQRFGDDGRLVVHDA